MTNLQQNQIDKAMKIDRLMSLLETDDASRYKDIIAVLKSTLKEIKAHFDRQVENNKVEMSIEYRKSMARLKEMDKKVDGMHEMNKEMCMTMMRKMVEDIKSTMATMKDADDLNNRINLLENKKDIESDLQVSKESIKGLEEEVKDLKKELEEIKKEVKQKALPRGTIGGMRKVPIIKRHNLTSQVDGATRTFTLPRDTVDVVGVFGTSFPINFNPGTDWTFSGNTLTLSDSFPAPESGQTLFAIVETLFYGS